MTEPPLISVVIAVFNGDRTIRRTLESLRSQSFKNFELIIKDAGSSDKTMDVVADFEDLPGKRISCKDNGIFDAWNQAISHCKGEWICFLGADDFLWDNDVFLKFSKSLRTAFPKHRYVYGIENIVTSSGDVVETFGVKWETVASRQVYENIVPHRGMMHHRTLFQDHGLFDTSFRIAGDYEFLRRELLQRPPLFIPDFVVVGGEWGGVSTKSDYIVKTALETKRAVDKQEGLHLIWQSYWKVCKAYIKFALNFMFGEHVMYKIADIYRRATGRRPRGIPN